MLQNAYLKGVVFENNYVSLDGVGVVRKWDPCLYQSHKLWANFYHNFFIISNFLSFYANWGNFGLKADEIRPILRTILEKEYEVWPIFIPVVRI